MIPITLDYQRLRTLTTGYLHGAISDVYEDIARITRIHGILTHQIPNALDALQPFLQARIPDQRFFDGRHDPTHTGTMTLMPLSDEEQDALLTAFAALPSPLARKEPTS